MPTYEYQCTGCGATFTHEESVTDHTQLLSEISNPTTMAAASSPLVESVRCPQCRSAAVVQQLSTFFANTQKKS